MQYSGDRDDNVKTRYDGTDYLSAQRSDFLKVVGGSACAPLSSQEPGFIYVYERSDSAVRQTCRQGVGGGCIYSALSVPPIISCFTEFILRVHKVPKRSVQPPFKKNTCRFPFFHNTTRMK